MLPVVDGGSDTARGAEGPAVILAGDGGAIAEGPALSVAVAEGWGLGAAGAGTGTCTTTG